MTGKQDPIKAIKAALTDELHVDPQRTPVACSMVDGSILLEGVVERVSQKKGALLKAMALAGPNGVIDRLRVRPANHMTDAEIREHFEKAIEGDAAFNGLKLSAEVNGGVIDIEGEVNSLSHKRLAGVYAWWIPGTSDVINSIEVVPPEDDNDDEISDALRQALERDKLVNDGEIRVHTENCVVTLDGVARSEEERDAAEEDAWYVWGVNSVINRIVVQTTPFPPES